MSVTVKSVKLPQQSVTLTKQVRRITVFVRDAAGDVHAETYRKPRRSKKKTKTLRIPERLARESTRAARTLLDTYLCRHERSNRKRRDGWLRDYGTNVLRANRKGMRKFKLRKVLDL